MPWTYSQSTGQLRHDGVLVGTGYSGAGTAAASGRNNPAMQGTANVGPIPQGLYTIGPLHNSPNTGPNVMNLTPNGHDALGRTDFQIHGNNATNNASHGCVIMPPAVRQAVSASADHQLTVVP
jgi:Tlde1 domain